MIFFRFYSREPEALFKPLKNSTHSPEAENKINEQIEKYKAKFTRHIFLIRHGQYNLEGKTDQERALTELGKIEFFFFTYFREKFIA